jgi:two-component system sensor kinase FixL
MFQTLSRRDDVKSIRVGFIVVKKIVEIYRGKIWVEPKAVHGNTFFFELPKQETVVKYERFKVDVAGRR